MHPHHKDMHESLISELSAPVNVPASGILDHGRVGTVLIEERAVGGDDPRTVREGGPRLARNAAAGTGRGAAGWAGDGKNRMPEGGEINHGGPRSVG